MVPVPFFPSDFHARQLERNATEDLNARQRERNDYEGGSRRGPRKIAGNRRHSSRHMLVDDLGLRSLDLARIIAKLEMKLGVDPFAELVSVTSIRTPGDLCAAYAKCFAAAEGRAVRGRRGGARAARPAPPARFGKPRTTTKSRAHRRLRIIP